MMQEGLELHKLIAAIHQLERRCRRAEKERQRRDEQAIARMLYKWEHRETT